MTYDELIVEIEATIESGTSLTLQDLTPEAQKLIRDNNPDGFYPVPDLENM